MIEFTEEELNKVISADEASDMIEDLNVKCLLLTHWGHMAFASHWEVCDAPKYATRRQFLTCAAQSINAYRITQMVLGCHHDDAMDFLYWCRRNRCLDATLPIKRWV